jgi:hypothetical protein
VENRGVISREGAGVHIGGGTNVYDAIEESGMPAVIVPGIHRGNYGHPCFRVIPTRCAENSASPTMHT